MRGIALIVRAGAVVCAFAFVFSLLVHGAPRPAAASREAVSVSTSPQGDRARDAGEEDVEAHATKKVPPGVVAIVATGDIVMGSTPNLPPDGGRSFFSDVQTDLAGDVVLGNLEGTLSTGGSSKCGVASTSCFAFHTPPSYARWLARAGFTVMNLANNHAFDYGEEGLQQTVAALDTCRPSLHRPAEPDHGPEGRRHPRRDGRVRAVPVGRLVDGPRRGEAARRAQPTASPTSSS